MTAAAGAVPHAAGEATRVAVVTGANKGIGWHIADQLVKAGGFQVLVACRDPSKGAEAAKALGAESAQLDLADDASVRAFAERIAAAHPHLDVLVNNAGTAFKGSDSTPFKEQTGPTLQVNYWGTVQLTDLLLPLLRKSAELGRSPRIVNVASMAGRLSQVSPALQEKFSSPTLTREELHGLVRKFEADVAAGRHREEGWGNSNYGLSKLALIAYTRIVAREEAGAIKVNACCPGYCDTDMTSHKGPRPADVGARNAVKLALLPDDGPSGEFWENEKVSAW